MPLMLLKHFIWRQKIELALFTKVDTVRLSKIGSERLIGRFLVLLLSEIVGCYASKNQNDSLPSSNPRAPQQQADQSSNCGSFGGYVGVGGYKGMGIHIYGRGDIA